jgi:hypothetical protein
VEALFQFPPFFGLAAKNVSWQGKEAAGLQSCSPSQQPPNPRRPVP